MTQAGCALPDLLPAAPPEQAMDATPRRMDVLRVPYLQSPALLGSFRARLVLRLLPAHEVHDYGYIMGTMARPPRERTPQATLVRHWIAFIRATEDHDAAAVRQTDAEVRAVAEQVAAFGVQPPTARPSQQEVVGATR
jgi:hypothetical protein